MNRVAFLAISLAVTSTLACGQTAPDTELLDATEAAAGIESVLGKIATTFVTVDSSGQVAVVAAPFGCATANQQSSPQPNGQVVYDFDQCVLSGVSVLNGAVQVAFQTNGSTLHMDVTSSALTIGTVTLSSWTASADVTGGAASRTMLWQSHAEGTTVVRGRARSFTRDASATLKWTANVQCVTADGQASGSFESSSGGTLHFDDTASSFIACADVCPLSGSEVRADDRDHPGAYLWVHYGKSGSASYTNERGQTFDFVPACAL